MLKQIITMLITRAIEIAIVTLGSLWLWNNMDASYGLWVIVGLLLTYAFYFGLTFSYDYKDLKYGEGIARL